MAEAPHPFAEVISIASALWTDAELAVWLTAPQPLLDNWTPLQLHGCGKSDQLLRVLRGIEEGVFI